MHISEADFAKIAFPALLSASNVFFRKTDLGNTRDDSHPEAWWLRVYIHLKQSPAKLLGNLIIFGNF